MTNLGGCQGVADRLAAVNAVHSETAMRLVEARDRTEGKCASAAFKHPASRASLSLLNNMIGDMPVFNSASHIEFTPAMEAALKAQLDARVQAVLAIIAVMINDASAEIAEMEALLDIIRAMDREFFDFADDPEAAAGKLPREQLRKFMHYYYREFFFTALGDIAQA